MSGFCFDEARITAVLKNGTEVSFKFLNEEHMEAALEFWQSRINKRIDRKTRMKDQIQQVQDAILEIEMDLTRMRHLMAQLKAKERAFDQRFSSRIPPRSDQFEE